MGGNYEKGPYHQLIDVMARLKSIQNHNSTNTFLPPSRD